MKILLYKELSKIEEYGDNACINFFTNSPLFKLEYVITDKKTGNFPHVGVSVREGLSIYYQTPTGGWRPYDLVSRGTIYVVDLRQRIENPKKIELMIYGPILSHIETLSVEIEDCYWVEKKISNSKEHLLILGGKNTFGLGVSSTGLMYSNILRRKKNFIIKRYSTLQTNYLSFLFHCLEKEAELKKYNKVVLELNGNLLESDINFFISYLEQNGFSQNDIVLWGIFYKREKHFEEKRIFLNLDYLFDDNHNDENTLSKNFINDAGNVHVYQEVEGVL